MRVTAVEARRGGAATLEHGAATAPEPKWPTKAARTQAAELFAPQHAETSGFSHA
jgi:hypothetical protein